MYFSTHQIVALLRVLYAGHVQVNKPDKTVLVHGIYVGQVTDSEEEDGGVSGDRFVT